METSERLQAAIVRLTAAGVETPRLEAQLLLAQALGTTRTAVVAGIYREPTAEQQAEFERLVQARESRIPLAYLRGTQEFFGLTFRVGPEVLIPRPETELLVEFALEKLEPAGTLADVGTGSGCILTATLANAAQARGVGFDLSDAALNVALVNLRQNGVAERTRLVQGDLLTGAGEALFEVIVSNPPYIPSAEVATLAPEVPFASAFARKYIIARACSLVNGVPTPVECDRIKFCCSFSISSFEIRTLENAPKPVLTP